MLFYNSQKEFIGMDEESLNSLGFSNLSELRSESANFADLFVRTPGFIHNFKYVHWIDYIIYSDSSEVPKAIIHTKARNFWCNISISTSYMVDTPATKAYIIELQNLRELSKKETAAMTEDILVKPTPKFEKEVQTPYIDKTVQDNIKKSIIEQDNSYHTVDDTYNSEVVPKHPVQTIKKVEAIEEDEQKEEILEEFFIPTEIETPIEEDESFSDYVFDPQVASDELGLPIDLIEEFIEDFIAQAKEFKDELFSFAQEEDINNVRILSHKLKGVAANLRVEDAFEVLATINTTTEIDIINKNLVIFYNIIAKLNGEEVDLSTTDEIVSNTEDEFILDFKDTNHTTLEPEPIIEKIVPIEEENDEYLLDMDNLLLDNEIPAVQKEETIVSTIEDSFIEEDILLTYNKEKAMRAMGLNAEVFDEFLSDYITDATELCNQIQEAISFNEPQVWNSETIKLKGMSENLRIELFIQELNILLETQNQSVALDAINKIISIISNLKD